MKILACCWRWLHRVMLRSAVFALACLVAGGAVAWVWFNLSSGPGVVIVDQEEAEGSEFSDPATLDIVTDFKRNRVCPAVTQRWVWRWVTYRGERIPDAYPVASTVTPFLADGGRLMLSLPNPAVSVFDPTEKWFFRSVTTEQCALLPTWVSMAFGTRIYRSKDRPVNFIGASHHE